MTETGTTATASRLLSGWTRRRKVLSLSLVIMMLAAVGLAGFLSTRPGPEDLVRDYLDALRSGDADTAREYVTAVTDLDTATDVLLADKAMSTDWKVTELVNRQEDGYSATVDVTITAADKTTRKGRFNLDANGSGDWRILNPLVKLDLTNLPMRFAEFNGVLVDGKTLDATAPSTEPETQPKALAWLFPGAYTPYGDSSDQLKLSADTFIALPSVSYSGKTQPQLFFPEITPTDALVADANAQLADWIDECAKSTAVNPRGCPFAGGSDAEPRHVSLDNGDDYLASEVKWKVKTQPVIRLLQAAGRFTVQEVEPGEVTISGTGTDAYSDDGSRHDFEGDCDIKLGDASAQLVEPETFGFESSRPGIGGRYQYTCSLRYD